MGEKHLRMFSLDGPSTTTETDKYYHLTTQKHIDALAKLPDIDESLIETELRVRVRLYNGFECDFFNVNPSQVLPSMMKQEAEHLLKDKPNLMKNLHYRFLKRLDQVGFCEEPEEVSHPIQKFFETAPPEDFGKYLMNDLEIFYLQERTPEEGSLLDNSPMESSLSTLLEPEDMSN
mmetsp:Transcript_14883/g.23073  ORF Transcript_14883/g.23073 Transcript_14883/m.23073 type:complete len:176 (-) Transcript_14883:13-540(-)